MPAVGVGEYYSLVYVQITAHEEDVNSVAFADQTSNILISGSDDGLCKVKVILLFFKQFFRGGLMFNV